VARAQKMAGRIARRWLEAAAGGRGAEAAARSGGGRQTRGDWGEEEACEGLVER
jgi:hypothetical protein